MSEAPAAFQGHGTKGYRAYVLTVLLIIYTFNFIDRILVGVVQEGIRHDLQLNDLQLGLLGGTFFAILYSVLGVPIARWAERANRVGIISLGAAIWSVMTAACGFAQNYVQLALARVGVGIGEAACVPPSHSLISDYFPPERRASALAIFALGVPIGSMFAAVAGGWLAQEIGWRAAFWLLGAPGLAAALLLFLTVREPPRAGAATAAPTFGEALKALAGKPSFWHTSFAAALVSFFGYSTAQFTISFLVRVHGLEIAQASYAFGAIAGVAVAAGTFLGGYLSDRWSAKRPRVLSWLPAIGVLAAVPVYALGYMQSSFVPALLLFMTASVLHYLYLGPIFAVAQGVVSPRVRATASAIMVLIINLIGYGLGPATAGALSDFFANQALATNGLTADFCAGVNAALRSGVPLPTDDTLACASASANGLRYAMMAMSLALIWAALHFMLAGRTLVKDRAVENLRPAPPAPSVAPTHRPSVGEIGKRLFISYSSQDRIKADALVAQLESAGVSCWIAPRDIRGGFSYAEEITHGIEESQALCVLISEAANASSAVLGEVELARRFGRNILPVFLDDVTPSKALLFYVGSTQWLNYTADPVRTLEHLRAAVGR